MGKLFNIPITVNKRNGQISSYFKKEQLPQTVRDAIKRQPQEVKRFKVRFEGWD